MRRNRIHNQWNHNAGGMLSVRGMLALLVFVSGCQRRELVEPTEAGLIRFVSVVRGFSAMDADGADTKSLGTVETDGAPSTFYLHVTESDWPVTDTPDTKSEPVTDVHSTMKVSGYSYSGAWDGSQLPNLFEGVTLTRSGSIWTGLNPKMQWPGAEYKVRFGAMSPAPGIAGLYWNSNSATAGMPVIEYTIPTTVSEQVDILECASAEYVGDGSTARSGVNMNFQHALTAVKVNISDFGFDAIVKSVSIDGVYNTGTHIIGENTWSGLSGSSSFLVSSLNKEITATGDFEIISAENTFLFLPQECPLGSTISITVSISGVDYIIKAPLAGQRWEPGKEVIYSISPSEQDWTTVLKLLNINETVSQTGDLIATVLSYRKHVTGIKEPLPWSVHYKVDGSYQSAPPYAFYARYSEQLGGWEGEDLLAQINSLTNEKYELYLKVFNEGKSEYLHIIRPKIITGWSANINGTFGGLHISPMPLYYDGDNFVLRAEDEEDNNVSSYNSVRGMNAGSYYFNFIEIGSYFDADGSSFNNTSGDIDNTNKISYAGFNDWRVPSQAEWCTITTGESPGVSRPGSTVNGVGGCKFALIQLNLSTTDVSIRHAGNPTPCGLLLFPDNCIITGKTLNGLPNSTNTGTSDVTLTELQDYLDQGCAFIPASGYATKSGWMYGGKLGVNWSSSSRSNTDAYNSSFGNYKSYFISNSSYVTKSDYYRTVRLVR